MNEMGGACRTYGLRAEVYTGFWWRNMRGRDYLEDPGVNWRMMLRWIFWKWDLGARTGSIWLRIGTVGGNL